jgi:hypothetical protein
MNMSGQSDNIGHPLDMNELAMLEILVRKEVNRHIKERPESVNSPDWIDAALHKLLEKLERSYSGILYEHPASDDTARVTRSLLRLAGIDWQTGATGATGARGPTSEDRGATGAAGS